MAKYYKVIMTNKTGGFTEFDYEPYLPTKNKAGNPLPKVGGKLELCVNGYHATLAKNLRFWFRRGCRIYLIRPSKERRTKAYGKVEDKACFRTITLLKDVTSRFVDKGLLDYRACVLKKN